MRVKGGRKGGGRKGRGERNIKRMREEGNKWRYRVIGRDKGERERYKGNSRRKCKRNSRGREGGSR